MEEEEHEMGFEGALEFYQAGEGADRDETVEAWLVKVEAATWERIVELGELF